MTNHFRFKEPGIDRITEAVIARYSPGDIYFDQRAVRNIIPESLEINHGVFRSPQEAPAFPAVSVTMEADHLSLACDLCQAGSGLLCEHQVLVLSALLRKEVFRMFFDERLRHEKLRRFAADYGLENEPDPDHFFRIEHADNRLLITPRLPGLIPVTGESLHSMRGLLVPGAEAVLKQAADRCIFVVIRQHKFYKHLLLELYEAEVTKSGKVKNPLNLVSPADLIWQTQDLQQLRFLSGIRQFQNTAGTGKTQADIAALRAVVKNPMNYPFYYHDSAVSENITAISVVPVKLKVLPDSLKLSVSSGGQFYELSASLDIEGQTYFLNDLSPRFTYFLASGDTLYLADNLQVLGMAELLKKKPEKLLVHASRYREFKNQLLGRLEDTVRIEYKHVKPATAVQLKQQGFNQEPEKIIYLSDFGAYVMIIPVMRYGEAEIPVRTKKEIYATDSKGNEFAVSRDKEAESRMIALLLKQHPYFEEQLENQLSYFYLHKKHFLNEEWFLNTFEEWQRQQVSVLGFDELEGNKLNPHKVNISIKVISGINWFNALIDVRFGKKKASMKQLYKAVRNKSRYVQLDDGTLGILPAEWLEKFADYFHAGEIADDESLRIAKINFASVEQLYDNQMLDEEVKNELAVYHQKLADFDSVKEVEVPQDLHGTLRDYQKQGLNWLNFLDDFNFGGCLADDMGLGKSIQVIAFILSQRVKAKHNTNLVVVPATLAFNWQQEVQKFAPSLKIRTIYGADRIRNTRDFNQYEIILTSYGTLLSDITFLKDYEFNYIFLDESQNIKNPESQRYKTVRLLKSRNKIVITGTPVENNTFDLYGQLSFACPGLLGSRQYFRDIYAMPIDKFNDSKRALELQNKISPFVLRRSKQKVAAELPEKTEMVLYCEMGTEQRRIYNAYEKEFRDFISATTNDELRKSPMNVLKGLTRLRQICDSPLLLSGEKLPGEASAKMDILIEQIEGKSHAHKILVFSQFVSMLNLVKKELGSRGINFTMLTGSTRNRDAVVNEFQGNPDVRVFLISLKAGGTGLNLTEADYVYLVDPWWNPAVENQAIDRAHRIGQDKKIVAVRLICPETVEEKIMKLQELKKLLADDLIRTDTSFIRSLSKNGLLDLLG